MDRIDAIKPTFEGDKQEFRDELRSLLGEGVALEMTEFELLGVQFVRGTDD